MNSAESISIGQVVSSIAGRDRGRMFIIVDIVDEQFVKVVDGDLRKVEKPKLKKVKHLNVSHHIIEEIAETLQNRRKLTNERIKKALENFTYSSDGGS